MFNKFFSFRRLPGYKISQKAFYDCYYIKQFDIIKPATMQIVQYKIVRSGDRYIRDLSLHPGIYTYRYGGELSSIKKVCSVYGET